MYLCPCPCPCPCLSVFGTPLCVTQCHTYRRRVKWRSADQKCDVDFAPAVSLPTVRDPVGHGSTESWQLLSSTAVGQPCSGLTSIQSGTSGTRGPFTARPPKRATLDSCPDGSPSASIGVTEIGFSDASVQGQHTFETIHRTDGPARAALFTGHKPLVALWRSPTESTNCPGIVVLPGGIFISLTFAMKPLTWRDEKTLLELSPVAAVLEILLRSIRRFL